MSMFIKGRRKGTFKFFTKNHYQIYPFNDSCEGVYRKPPYFRITENKVLKTTIII